MPGPVVMAGYSLDRPSYSNALIVVSTTPAVLAVVAAPMRKLWPLKRLPSMPATLSASWTALTKACLCSGVPSGNGNREPGAPPPIEVVQEGCYGAQLCLGAA